MVERRPEKAGVASSILAPGTIRTYADQIPIPAEPITVPFRSKSDFSAVFGELCLCPWNFSGEEPVNIPQPAENKSFDLLESSINPATIRRQKVVADFVQSAQSRRSNREARFS